MSSADTSKNHHWWPVGLQSYWTDKAGDVSWIEPSGAVGRKRAANRKIGHKIHGHTLFKGSDWEHKFEDEFDVDNEVHNTILAFRKLKPLGYSLPDWFKIAQLLFKKDRSLRDYCKFFQI